MTHDSIVVEMFYPHPVEKVWNALIDPNALATWLMPNDFQPRIGHRFTFRTTPDQQWSGVVQCEVLELDSTQHRLVFSWVGGVIDTLVTFSLTSGDGGTQLRFEHSGFEAGGDAGLTIRDMLASGWNSKVLRERLPAYLDEQAKLNVSVSE